MFVLVAQAASMPTAPVISATVLSPTSIRTTLVTPSTEPTFGIGSYTLYYSTVSSVGPFTQIVSGLLAGSFPYTWTGASAGTNYWMMVTGVDNSPNHKASPPSNTPNVTTTGSSSGLPNMPMTYYNNAATDSGLPNSAAYIAWLANFNFVELVYFPGATVGGGSFTYDTYMAAIKAKAAQLGNTFCRTGKYWNSTRVVNTVFTGMQNAVTDTLAAGTPLGLMSGPGTFPGGSTKMDGTFTVLDMADSAPVSSVSTGRSAWTHGLNAATAEALYEWNTSINGTGAAVNQSGSDLNPQCDFIFHDNFNWCTIFSGQYLGTSTVYPVENSSGNDPIIAPHLQQGYSNFLTKFRALGLPAGRSTAIRHLANCQWIADTQANGQGPTVYAPCQGLIDMPFGEAGLGSVGYAVMGYRSPARFFQVMQNVELLRSSDPEAVCVFNTEGGGPFVGTTWPSSQSNWTNSVTGQSAMPTNFGQGVATNASSSTHTFSGNYWQALRYSFGFACMRNWVWDLDNIPFAGGAGQCWFDELNKSAGIGGGNYNWFGPSSAPSPATATLPISGGQLNGVYRNNFPNGDVYLNPIGNGPVSYTLQAGDKKRALSSSGLSDPSVNTGALLTVLNLNDGDCRVLVN